MALDKINPFGSNPFQTGQNQIGAGFQMPQTQGPQTENQMYGNAGGSPKGELFKGFSLPKAENNGTSFLGQGALGDSNALYGQDNARLGAKLNLVG